MSIRWRLTLLYSVLLFGLAALVVAGVYAGLARSLDDEPISQTVNVTQFMVGPDGRVIRQERPVRAQIQGLEELVNDRALDQLRRYSFGALGLLFVASLGIGWLVAGRVLRPIGEITGVARDIQAHDLSRRIDLRGPPNDELKQLADTFDAMLARLDQAFAAQREFIQETSHELRNPLAVIRTNLDVALADPDTTAAEFRETTGVIARTVDRMSHVVDDLLRYARHGAPQLAKEPVDLASVVTDAAEEFRAPAESRDVALEAVAPEGIWVQGDRVALRQALANLLANAVRHAPEGSRVRVAAGVDRGWAWMAVEDQGPGIPEDERDLVFHRFWRKDAEGAPAGSGLGLSIVRQVAEGHGGEVRLASEVGQGATFSVWLPAISAP
ncbi:MAG TPA: HAMP domain-containing sensor histidine kinase [Acidimicrobiales bacterium]|nr:HAMP domain-containing sensor histidine kinase [Acidimicrobiales bacterium]